MIFLHSDSKTIKTFVHGEGTTQTMAYIYLHASPIGDNQYNNNKSITSLTNRNVGYLSPDLWAECETDFV